MPITLSSLPGHSVSLGSENRDETVTSDCPVGVQSVQIVIDMFSIVVCVLLESLSCFSGWLVISTFLLSALRVISVMVWYCLVVS